MHIFVSYRRRASLELAQEIKGAFETIDKSLTVFLDTRDGVPGEDFPNRLEMEIEEADLLVVLVGPDWLTPEGNITEWISREVSYAIANGIPILPVLHDGGTLPAVSSMPASVRGLARANAINYGDLPNGLTDLHRQVKTVLRRKSLSFRSPASISSWMKSFIILPIAPIRSVRHLSRGGTTSIVAIALLLFLILSCVYSIILLITGLSTQPMTVLGGAAMTTVATGLVAVLLGVFMAFSATLLGGTWRPIRATAGCFVMVAAFMSFSIISTSLFFILARLLDPEFNSYLTFGMGSSAEVLLDSIGGYFDNSPRAAQAAISISIVFALATVGYLLVGTKTIGGLLRLPPYAQWGLAATISGLTAWLFFHP